MLRKLVLTLTAWLLAATATFASADHGTRDEAVAMAGRAIAMLATDGLDATIAAVHDPDNATFHDRDLYVIIFKLDGTNLAHGIRPELAGKDLSGLKDQDGKHVFVEMRDIVMAGNTGWVDYKWPNPTTKAIENKSTYVAAFGDGMLIGVGIYAE